ncbi:hypothetical protein [Chitinivibrio alkaliphilus]|uniref:Lipoprotein n=1 Tax=Chitinivibrio alkaliphilus ACht1 TaxID=1313304 RepID=U7D8J1_9BACT|nr:hypothetical protein [Chitinivibrio alkaliphilus]ERP31871.1 hypothetical protein CALK_1086 [Chitinivibrio alkaliphilus ACht1]
MKSFSLKCVLLCSLLLLFFGCDEVGFTRNEVTFVNKSNSPNITVLFRAEEYSLSPGEEVTIEGVPRGSYSFSTEYVVPADEVGDADIDGTVSFETNTTKVRVTYNSNTEMETDDDGNTTSTFHIWALTSSTDG